MFPVVSRRYFDFVRSVLHKQRVDSTNSWNSLFIDLISVANDLRNRSDRDRQAAIWNATLLCRSPGFNDSSVVWGVKLPPLKLRLPAWCGCLFVWNRWLRRERERECWPHDQRFVVCFTSGRVICCFPSHLVERFQKQSSCKMRFLMGGWVRREEKIPS